MSADQGPTQPPVSESADVLAEGDAAAVAGRWPHAVSAWQLALSTARRAEAIERLRWFVAWRTTDSRPPARGRPKLSQSAAALIATAGCGLLATACVFLADTVEGAPRAILVTLAWVLFTAAAVLSIIYAQRTGHTRRGEIGRKELARLCAEASTLSQPDVAPPTVMPQQGLQPQPLESQGFESQRSGV